jgi:type VI secretion system protein ImpA
MRKQIDIDVLLALFPGDNPSGEDLRYSQVYDDIKEARRYDDPLDQGEWKTEIKKADWDRVINLAIDALSGKTKDLQIAVWLAEALIVKEGFEGSLTAMRIINGLIRGFWDSLYPLIEDDDLEYRIAPLELMNEKLSGRIQQVPVTDPARTLGYSWLKWQESRQIGYDADSRDKDANQKREEALAEGKISADEFDSAVAMTSPGFYKTLSEILTVCLEEFRTLDSLVDEKFGREAPRISEFGKAFEDANELVQKICKDKGLFVAAESESVAEEAAAPQHDEEGGGEEPAETPALVARPPAAAATITVPAGNPSVLIDSGPWEQALWDDAVRTMKAVGTPKALEKLMEASLAAPSVRGASRYKLLLSKVCLQANRPDLARPILEQLYGLIDELHLEKWESPVWIADVLGALYLCLMSGEPSDDDFNRAQELFQRLCTIDITKAITYRK